MTTLETTDARDALGDDLRDRVLDRLGFVASPLLTVDGLNALYSAWGRFVPFDNVHKRIALARGAPLPCRTPREFFAGYLAHGTGATCWPSSAAFHALLRACGFEASRVAGRMVPGLDHGSVLVRLAGAEYLVDTLMASDVALPLTREATAAGVGASRVRAEPHGASWRVWWLHPARDEERYFEVKELEVSFARVLEYYESSRSNSPFNARLFARKNIAGRVVCIAQGARHVRDVAGITSRPLAPGDTARVLIEEFGFGEHLVARLPPDEPAP